MAIVPPGLVWLASFPKSGNTWMRALLANLVDGRAEPADINRLDLGAGAPLQASSRFSDDTLVDPDLLHQPELERLRAVQCDFAALTATIPLFCKTHDRFVGSSGVSVLGTQARRALYLLRDPRDVAVSFAHHVGQTVDRAIADLTGDDLVMGGPAQVRQRTGNWGDHVTGWTAQTELPVMTVRYEDLRRDTAGCLAQVLAFLDAQATREEIDRAVRHARFEEMQRQETVHGFRERLPRQTRFFRAGRVGEWRDALTPAQIRIIEDRFAPVMEQWGYAPTG